MTWVTPLPLLMGQFQACRPVPIVTVRKFKLFNDVIHYQCAVRCAGRLAFIECVSVSIKAFVSPLRS